MADIDFKTFGGLNTQIGIHDSKILYFSESNNIELFQGAIRRMRGQEEKLTLPAGILGMFEYEDNDGYFELHAICDNGNHYSIEPLTASYDEINTGLTTSGLKPQFSMFNHTLITCTASGNPYSWDGTTISAIDFYSVYSKYPTCSVAFAGRMWYASDNLLAWTAANTTDDLETEGDAGYKDNFNGRITNLRVFSTYLVVTTTTDIYVISGTDNTNFLFTHYSNIGIKSRNGIVKLDNKLYIWNNGLFPIEYTGDMAQVRIANPLTNLIQNSIQDIDTFRLDEIIMIPYENRKQIWVYVPIVNETDIYRCWIINFENYQIDKAVTCYKREGNSITGATNFRGKIYSGDSNGIIYEEDKGNLFGNNVIEGSFKFCPIQLGTTRIKDNYEEIQLILNSRSINKFKFTSAYDGEFYDPDEIDVDDITVEDNYFVLNETEVTSDSISVVNDYVSTVVNILDEWKIIQIGMTAGEDEDFILEQMIFMDSKINAEY